MTAFPTRLGPLGQAGAAAVEFALSAPFLIFFFIGTADFAIAYHRAIQLSEALTAGALYGFTQGQTESGSTLTSDVTSFVQSVSAVTLSSVTAAYNGGLAAASCYCVQGAALTFTGPVTCGSTCTDGSGSTAGKYLTITGTFTYTPMFPSDQMFFTSPLTQTVLVRVK
jgi:Flp pilus assembly protein TadG